MRNVAVIVAAVLTVFTGGPLRCPCQVAALLRDHTPAPPTRPPTPPADEASRCGCCSCKAHRDAADPKQSAEREPAPGNPCPHCPNIYLVLPVTNAERLPGDHDHGDWTAGPFDATPAVPLTRHPHAVFLPVSDSHRPAPDRLRYCHSFRC